MHGYFFGKSDNLEKFIKKETAGPVKLDWTFARPRVFEKPFINPSYAKKPYKYVHSTSIHPGVLPEQILNPFSFKNC